MWEVEKRLSNSQEEARSRLRHTFLSEENIRKEFIEELPSEIARRIDPAPIELGWNKIKEPIRTEAMLDLLMDYGSNLEHYPTIQALLRTNACPVLLLWGELDQYLTPEAAHAYLRDVPRAELHFYDGGHWLLETNTGEVNSAVRSFLSKHCL